MRTVLDALLSVQKYAHEALNVSSLLDERGGETIDPFDVPLGAPYVAGVLSTYPYAVMPSVSGGRVIGDMGAATADGVSTAVIADGRPTYMARAVIGPFVPDVGGYTSVRLFLTRPDFLDWYELFIYPTVTGWWGDVLTVSGGVQTASFPIPDDTPIVATDTVTLALEERTLRVYVNGVVVAEAVQATPWRGPFYPGFMATAEEGGSLALNSFAWDAPALRPDWDVRLWQERGEIKEGQPLALVMKVGEGGSVGSARYADLTQPMAVHCYPVPQATAEASLVRACEVEDALQEAFLIHGVGLGRPLRVPLFDYADVPDPLVADSDVRYPADFLRIEGFSTTQIPDQNDPRNIRVIASFTARWRRTGLIPGGNRRVQTVTPTIVGVE